MSKIRDEEEKRKETQTHFQQSINEIFSTLGKNNDENLKIKEANLEMTKKYDLLKDYFRFDSFNKLVLIFSQIQVPCRTI